MTLLPGSRSAPQLPNWSRFVTERDDDERERERERDADDGKSTGVAQRWNTNGFGFIKPDDGGEDLFCHYSSILDGKMLKAGDKVRFVKKYDEIGRAHV